MRNSGKLIMIELPQTASQNSQRVSISWADGQREALDPEQTGVGQEPYKSRRPSLAAAAAAIAEHAQQLRFSQVEGWLVPDVRSSHLPLASPLLTLVLWATYCFMAGRYPSYTNNPSAASTAPEALTGWGPRSWQPWLVFWGQGLPLFDAGYLYTWGARWAPALADGQGWRLLTSVVLHSGPAHLVSNTLLWLLLAVGLEHTYGAVRITAIFLLSALGGSFLSMVAEDPCSLYVGASGGIFGFLGLYLADVALNYQTMVLPLLRLALLVLGVGAQLALEFGGPKPAGEKRVTSHLSHLGGFFTGAAVSFLFLPRLQDRRWRKVKDLSEKLGLKVGSSSRRRPTSSSTGGADDEEEGRDAEAGNAQEMMADDASTRARTSCWSRNRGLYWVACGLCGLVALVFLVAMPGYAYGTRLQQLQCAPIPGVA